jgi:tetratricopeptide (TPR) repeat protein
MLSPTRSPRLTVVAIAALAMAGALAGCTSEADRYVRRAKDAASEGNDLEAAVEYIDQALILAPDVGRHYRRKGDWMVDLGRYDEALVAYDGAVTALEPSMSAHLKAVELCIEQGRLNEAENWIQRAQSSLESRSDLEELEQLRQELAVKRAEMAAAPTDNLPAESQSTEENVSNP